jgi:hypothetical protein
MAGRPVTDPDGRTQWLRGLTGQALGSDQNDKKPWVRWNGELQAQVLPPNLRLSFGDHNAPDGASILAFSAAGLSKMGLPEPSREKGPTSKKKRPDVDLSRNEDSSGICSFPPVFRMGMVNRKNVLGDQGSSDPAKWLWRDGGVDDGTAEPVEAALLVYGPSPDLVDNADNKAGLRRHAFMDYILSRTPLLVAETRKRWKPLKPYFRFRRRGEPLRSGT